MVYILFLEEQKSLENFKTFLDKGLEIRSVDYTSKSVFVLQKLVNTNLKKFSKIISTN